MSDNPFVVKIPKGATEIDLGPILRPIIFKLLKDRLTDPSLVDDYMAEADQRLAYRLLIEKISRPMVIDYLKSNGWEPEDDREFCFRKDWDMRRLAWDRSGPRVWTSDGRGWNLHKLDEAIKAIGRDIDYRAPLLNTAKAILAHANVLDQIAQEL